MPLLLNHPQQASDRTRLLEISQYLPNWPNDFTFPTLDPNYRPRANTTYLLIIAPILAVITFFTVLLRLHLRRQSKFGTDDWVISVAFVSVFQSSSRKILTLLLIFMP